ncbi:uncharacterized protein BCR38DRAFT_486654 [Pseudomassariella vexata]|uniref:Uncharacterized protein n=1 Tax=Pseudomassariella vexata TaxID=1141098 RepID=A0A1Y2DTC8_9PEZI|nr:uncharacterized protein BCR38DRAFT_486654 [Pseudomassariella vexata]ORY62396.1 hypothetical protein BCR38DRAFT_486654 [Pseudomassariella vexata]
MRKRVPAAVATVGIVYGIAKYKQYRSEQQQRSQYSTRRSAAEQHSNALMNAYGDRSSLAELEQAIKEYEAQQGRR